MKPFNLERALAGDPVGYRDGSEIVTEILKSKSAGKPVIAVVKGSIRGYYSNGSRMDPVASTHRNNDLVMLPVKKTYYQNIVRRKIKLFKGSAEIYGGALYPTEAEADQSLHRLPANLEYIQTIKIEIEE